MQNTYSSTWFDLFLKPIDVTQTEREVAWISSQLALPEYRTVLDVCCGWGRHARLLAQHGYEITGVDLNADALVQARKAGGAATYIQHDMRMLDQLPGTFDAVLILWQSFGYFDAATNAGIIEQIGQKLRFGGRLILDVYHRDFFAAHEGERSFERDGLHITERRHMDSERLLVELEYGAGRSADRFDWQLYTPDELCALGEAYGFACQLACSDFDSLVPATSSKPRMQVVLEKKR